MSLSTAAVCFIACHGGPANHFATFAEELPKHSIHFEVYAAGPALTAFASKKIAVNSFTLEDEDIKTQEIAQKILKSLETYPNLVVITDIGHSFAVKMQSRLQEHNIKRLAYYDNPEPYVPGGYSTFATPAMALAQGILFANKNLADAKIYEYPNTEIAFLNIPRTGIGYYPTEKADILEKRRTEEQSSLRMQLFPDKNFEGKRIIAYFGGNNDAYFGKEGTEGAFPAFLRLLSESIETTDLSHVFILIQQHPGAKPKQIEDQLVKKWQTRHSENKNAPQIVISHFGSDEAQVIADAAAYYQTSMNFVLAGIDHTFQVAHETFEDSLVKMGFPSVTTASRLKQVIQDLENPKPSLKEAVLENLGTDPHWANILADVITKQSS